MRQPFAAAPVYRFNERAILVAFHRREALAGTFVLQTARSLDRGPLCMAATGNLKQALLHAVRDPFTIRPPGSGRWRFWRYLPTAAKYSTPPDFATWLQRREAS